MRRLHQILGSVNETLSNAAQKTYKGQKRSELKDSDFLFPETRSFPIVTPQDVPDAISNFGRMKGGMSYESFLKKLYNMVKRKGPEFVAALPEASKKQLGITSKAYDCGMNQWNPYEEDRYDLIVQSEDEMEMEEDEEEEEEEEEEESEEMTEYKQDFYNMSVGSLLAVMTHAKSILDNLQNPNVKENLTAPHLQGMIAVLEDHMRSVHDFVMFVPQESEDTEAASKPGLWENIRRKKEKMGKNYKPAKPGDKDRPNPDAYKRAQG